MRYIRGYIIDQLTHRFRIDARYFFSGAVWLTIIQAITVLGALIVSVFAAHFLSEADYGTYRYIIGIGALLGAVSLTGIGQSIFQTASHGHTWFYKIGVSKSNLYGTGVTVISLFASLYYFLQDNNTLALGCILIALFQSLLNTYQQIFSFLQGTKRFKESTIIQGIKTITLTSATIVVLLFTHNILWLILVYFLGNTLINFIVHVLYSPKKTGAVDDVVQSRYLLYAYNTSIRNVISIIAFRIDSIIVFQQLGAAQLAIYAIANIIPENIKASFKNVSTLLIPKYAAQDNLDNIKKSLLKRSLQFFCVTVAVMLLYILIAPLVYKILFPKYHDSILLSQLISLSFPAMTALIPLSALQAHTKEKALSSLNTSSSLLTIMTTLSLTLYFGLMGAVFAKIVSRYVTLLLTYYYFFNKE